jgi:hypothetical protein
VIIIRDGLQRNSKVSFPLVSQDQVLLCMDVYRHLQGLGWRGSGFSLDESDRGLKKPLLISRKSDSRGVGSKTPAGRQADHWWLTAYDSALSTLGDKNQVRPTKTLSNHC